MPPVIDIHIHLPRYENPSQVSYERIVREHPDDPEGFLDRINRPEAMLRTLDTAGVDLGVILAEYSPITTGICTNDAVYDFCQGQERLIPFANVNPYLQVNPAQELERLIVDMGFKGVKFYPTYNYFYPNDAMMYPLYAVAQRLRVPVMVHTGSSVFPGARLKYGDPLYLDDVAVDFPDLTLLAVHSGRGFWYDRAFFLARLHRNLYMEIAGVPPQNLPRYFPELERNADKIIFGSDYPDAVSIKNNVEVIRGLPLASATIDKILGGNAARILGLE